MKLTLINSIAPFVAINLLPHTSLFVVCNAANEDHLGSGSAILVRDVVTNASFSSKQLRFLTTPDHLTRWNDESSKTRYLKATKSRKGVKTSKKSSKHGKSKSSTKSTKSKSSKKATKKAKQTKNKGNKPTFAPTISISPRTMLPTTEPTLTSTPSSKTYNPSAVPTLMPSPFDRKVWTRLGLRLNGDNQEENSGYSVSLSVDGRTVAVGAPGSMIENTESIVERGSVRVYTLDSTNSWNQIGQTIVGKNVGHRFGYSVDLSSDGKTIAIGAPGNSVLIDADSEGSVLVFKIDENDNWKQVGLDIDGKNVGDRFGWSVSLSAEGNTVASGAPFTSSLGNLGIDNANVGRTQVFSLDESGSWSQLGQDINGDSVNGLAGSSISLSADGKILAMDSTKAVDGVKIDCTEIYQLGETNNWQQLGEAIDSEDAGDNNGFSISLSANGKTVATSSTNNDGDGKLRGHVRVFSLDESKMWKQIGADIDGDSDFEQAGFSVSLSADGKRVAVGVPTIGRAQVFELFEDNWYTAFSFTSEDVSASFGWSVSLSTDGETLAVGAPSKNFNSGSVKLFSTNYNRT